MKTIPLGQHPPLDIDNDRMPDLKLQAPAYQPPLPEATLAAALIRTEADVDHVRLGQLNALAWFVKLAQVYIPNASVDLPHASPGDILAKREEFAALEQQLQVRQSPPLPSTKNLCLLSIQIQHTLEDLYERGVTTLGPFPVSATSLRIELPLKPSSANPVDRARHIADFNRAIGVPSFQQDQAVWGRQGLFMKFTGLLRAYVTSLHCCPHCETLFVKPRQNADYCSRSCQNKHYMQTEREIANTKKRAVEALKLKSKTHKKGRKPHGTKRHR